MKKFMLEAINQAKMAQSKGEIPVGAVIVKNDKIISYAHNMREETQIATYHAEVLAIEKACKTLSSWRLNDCELYVTLEPCIMCVGAIYNARIKRIYFGAYDKNFGCLGGKVDIFNHFLKNNIEIYGGIMEKECEILLSETFKSIRE